MESQEREKGWVEVLLTDKGWGGKSVREDIRQHHDNEEILHTPQTGLVKKWTKSTNGLFDMCWLTRGEAVVIETKVEGLFLSILIRNDAAVDSLSLSGERDTW